jgi:hypothetical protein
VNKKLKVALFVLVATVFNVVTTLICFAGLALLYVAFIVPRFPDKAAAAGFIPLFVAAFALAFLIYRAVLKQFLKKHPLPGRE